jgi:hypothetical protein
VPLLTYEVVVLDETGDAIGETKPNGGMYKCKCCLLFVHLMPNAKKTSPVVTNMKTSTDCKRFCCCSIEPIELRKRSVSK